MLQIVDLTNNVLRHKLDWTGLECDPVMMVEFMQLGLLTYIHVSCSLTIMNSSPTELRIKYLWIFSEKKYSLHLTFSDC